MREQAAGVLGLGFSCAPCGTTIPLCFATTADEVCCTGCTYTSYASSVMSTTRSGASGLALGQTYYHNGGTGAPVINNFVYSDDKGTTKLGIGYYKISATLLIYVNNDGMVTETFL